MPESYRGCITKGYYRGCISFKGYYREGYYLYLPSNNNSTCCLTCISLSYRVYFYYLFKVDFDFRPFGLRQASHKRSHLSISSCNLLGLTVSDSLILKSLVLGSL